LAQTLATCKHAAHQITASLDCSVELRVSVRLVDFDHSSYVTAFATCTCIIFQFILLILLCERRLRLYKASS